MLLVIDAGNTNTVFAVFDGKEVRGKWRISAYNSRTADEYAAMLAELMRISRLDFKDIHAVILCTVVPQNLFALKSLCRDYLGTEAMVVGDPEVKTGIEINIDRPSEVGADRVVNAVAAYQQCHCAAIVVDFGTATTFDVIDEQGNYKGGLIAPGINLSLDALHRAAAKLPKVGVEKPTSVIGKNTISAIQSGVYFGYLGLIEGIITRTKNEFGKDMHVIATGGLSTLFGRATDTINQLEPDLTIHGLQHIYEINA